MNTFNEKFNEICKDENLVGANIVVADTNNILELASYGLQDIDEKTPSTENTIYRIASISKTIGSIGLMQLYEKGLIDLDEDISTYLGFKVVNPNYPNDKITVKMLTMQTSSIQDGYDDENPDYDDIIKGYNGINGTYLDVSLKTLLTDKTSEYYTNLTFGNYKPGTRFCYSNFGCGIMACIIEKVSGELYVDYMENHVFKPLGLNASFKAGRLDHQENIATMYYRNSCGLRRVKKDGFVNSGLPVFPLGNNYRGPAGGLFITMKDLSILMRVFLNYGTYNGVKILKRETVEEMYQITWEGYPKNDDYRAKGLQMKVIRNVDCFTLRGHTGGAYGVRSYMFFNLKHKIGACFITNGIDSDSESLNCRNAFYKTQILWLEKHSQYMPTKAIINKKEIILPERMIKHKNLFIDNQKYILGKAFCDVIDKVGVFDEDKLTLTIDDKVINNIIMYNDDFYIDLLSSLEMLNIKHVVNKDNVTIEY